VTYRHKSKGILDTFRLGKSFKTSKNL